MEHPSSSQAKEMADESMVRNLAAQAQAIWPQEEPIFDRHPIGSGAVLDVGCGTGEMTERLAAKYPKASFTGIDLIESHLDLARERCARFGPRTRFQVGDALALPFDDASFDYVVCRHLIQAVPDATQVLREIRRVLRSGGRAHVIAEDYGMLWCHPMADGGDSDRFWQVIPPRYAKVAGCDLHVGRKAFTILSDLKYSDIRVDYIVVDTTRVPRDTFARIWEAWRDGYTDVVSDASGIPRAEVASLFQQMIDSVRDPRGYALWQVPLWTCGKP
jgi:SAM-dependent methyltransferase